MVMGRLYAELLDVQGAFLKGEFANGESIYMEVPQGFGRHYKRNDVLLLKRTMHLWVSSGSICILEGTCESIL
jgi:hypothetical protein